VTEMPQSKYLALQPHLFTYTYAYQPKFEFSTLNLELILGFFFSIEVYFPAFAFR
jgi:hypothetical protein